MPHPLDGQVVKQVFTLYATGEASDARVAEFVNQCVLTLPDGSESRPRQRGMPGRIAPRSFSKDMLCGLLKNMFYTGKVAYRGIDAKGDWYKRRPPLEIGPGLHPPLIDEDTFRQMQELRMLPATSIRQHSNSEIRIYPLTGLLRYGY